MSARLVDTQAIFEEFNELLAANEENIIAFDSEGVDLSRCGLVNIISVAIQSSDCAIAYVFDMDLANVDFREAQFEVLKTVLEDATITKIVHDCRQDSDALSHLLGIDLINVFDTSVWGLELSGSTKRDNLNSALSKHGLIGNPNRSKNIYKENPAYWSARPLTRTMIDSAGLDVIMLFELRRKMMAQQMKTRRPTLADLDTQCASALVEYRSLQFHELIIMTRHMGRVIGSGGSTIDQIQRDSGAIVSGHSAGFLVLAESQSALDTCKRMIRSQASIGSYSKF